MVELKSFLKKWRKGVKKYNAKLISEIYEHIQDSDNVGDDYRYLIESGYFQSVLWDLFDRNDTVSDTHLELIAKLVIFDLEVPDPGASRGLLSLLLSEREKFNEYMVAITRLCEVGRPLVTCLLQLLYVFHCSGNEHVLQWFINKTSFRFLTGYGQSEEPLDSIDGTKFFFDCLIKQAQPAVSRCLNKLLVACLCKKSELRDTLLELLRETAFTLDDYIVRYYLYYSENADGDERSQKFTKLQLTVQAYIENKEESTGSDNSLKWFTLVPSIYDLNLEEATEFLLGLPNDLLKDMCKELDICQHLPAALLARYHETVVAKIVDELHFGLSFDLLQNIKSDINSLNNTEKEVSTDLIPSFFSLSLHDFIFKTFMNYSRDFRTQVGAHLDQVLKRLSISNEGAASGTSKYATSIKSRTQGDSSDTSILVLSKNISTSVGEVILLVEILKPNKYGSTDLVQKYGVTDMKWATVLGQKGNSISIKVDSPINDETFNWAIRIPETIGNPWKLFLDEPKKVAFLSLPQVLYNAFMGGEVADLDLTNRSFDFYCKDVLSLLNKVYPDMVIEHENSTKRIKIDSSNEFQEHGDISALRVNFGHSERTAIPIASRSNSDTLSISSMRALISVLAGGLTTIETLPHSNLELVNTIIFHLRTNFPLERILVCSSTQNIPSSLFLSGDLKEDQVILNNTIADLKRLSQTLIGKINIFSDTESVTIEEATVMLTSVESRWLTFLQKVKHDPTVKSLKDYPFHTDFEPEEGDRLKANLKKLFKYI